ncbi:MAG: hypothetical protein RLZZ427_1956 [Pseudomonadota bacterium]|jgi:Na+/H+-dicarboxylate symporter
MTTRSRPETPIQPDIARGSETAAHAIIPEIRVPTALTLGALIGGLVLGLALGDGASGGVLALVLGKLGNLWLRALQVTIVPLVVSLLVIGVVQSVAAANAGALARRTLLMIFGLLAAATAMAALVTPLLLEAFPIPAAAAQALLAARDTTGPVPSLLDFFDSLVPANVLAAAAADAMLPLILFTAVFALAITRLAAPLRQALFDFFAGIAGAMMVVIGWVLKIAPVGVFGLAFTVAVNSGSDAIAALGHYILSVVAVGSVVLIGGYAMAVVGARLRLGEFARAVLPAQSLALSTQSSLACLPAMIEASRGLKVRTSTAELVLPLAVALFRVTGPAMNLAVALYVAKLAGMALTPALLMVGFAVAFCTTIGSVSLPGSISFIAAIGPICIAAGIPIAPLGLLVAVEMLPDLMRTLGNVTMDVALTATIDRRTR